MKPINKLMAEDALLAPYLSLGSPTFDQKVVAFMHQQRDSWPELRQAHEGLQQSLYKKFFLADLAVELQHNPFRMKSSTARVDKQSIKKRRCFLCPENLYSDQRALA